MLVAVSLFIVVVTAVSASFIGIVDSYRKTRALRVNMDNLSTTIESIVRGVKTGLTYHCGSTGTITTPQNCASGSSYFAFESASGNPLLGTDQIVYTLGPQGAGCPSANQICRSTDSGANFYPITAGPPQITIDTLRFYVLGADSSDAVQPRVVISIKGTTGLSAKEKTSFSMQTMITQRTPDEE